MRIKYFWTFILSFIVITTNLNFAWAEEIIKVQVDGKLLNFDITPKVINGRTMVPLRAIFESLGINIQWESASQKVIGTKGDTKIIVQIDNKVAYVNGKEVNLESAAVSIGGRTLVPARFIAESIGALVSWDKSTSTVNIYSPMTVKVNDEKSSIQVVEINSNIYAKLKDLAKVFLCTFDTETHKYENKVSIWRKNLGILMKIGDKNIYRGDIKAITSEDADIRVIDGEYYCNINPICEGLQGTANWNKASSLVNIYTSKSGTEFTLKTLNTLVEKTPVNQDIKKFREGTGYNEANNIKMETKYFDVFYPQNDKLAKEYADEIKKYADTAYVYLSKLYNGLQVPVDVYIINENDAANLKEGDIRRIYNATFIPINEQYNKSKGNIVANLIHEMHHSFYAVANNKWAFDENTLDYFVDEGITRIIPSIYCQSVMPLDSNITGYLDQWSVDFHQEGMNLKNKMIQTQKIPTWRESAKFLRGDNWGNQSVERDTAIVTWIYLYDRYGIEKFKRILNDIKGNYDKIGDIYGKSFSDLEKEFFVELMK